ncbi:hypothetical protein B6D25_01735 [Micrococcus luteus]|uniref:SGNH hydrolase-type esterase domain-containing protein n=1 Tax=Micrococcus luteus (strain ATCC 4698 / DSM 20030 / JCM 1464 / CCM 169 / CCUG 5858 / IAM 1056 / NBRC 3333 / NCIMB 9278 / NCTC 2665 / VKM Ac-2230) TaxID=465515 RepID=C5C9F6_MICLC|nr:SGNH/GDSL hydrolase family protein [Micrococcus luteus]ACS30108.1 hypothetical protein Mlut_05700 [Micrococcus luteus NCTC 2665]AJO55228.1 hypothetical protein BF96_02900 [Micrococcus luteus]KAB1903275.1 SGNH/GDSL hydrolase family protein [Micrococcus luteus NCTC 2665]ORE62983.1 hypothetical protein B6D25_01735 [Micrococcus luteus]QCY43957.1 SGNH/GDSL hydrolase family protein [Micrococcus luteus]
MKTSSKIALLVLLVVAGAAAFLALNRPVVSPAAEAENRSPVPVHSYSADTRPTVEVYGDSIAVADSPNFAGAESGPSSWTSYINDEGLRFVGGSAQGGRTSGESRGEDRGILATFVVYAFGTNDLRTDVPFEEFASNAREFADLQDPREMFVVVALGPMNDRPQDEVEEWNARLGELASEEGWTLVDPWEGIRGDDNAYVEGFNQDALHPNEEGAALYAQNMAEQLLAAYQGRDGQE